MAKTTLRDRVGAPRSDPAAAAIAVAKLRASRMRNRVVTPSGNTRQRMYYGARMSRLTGPWQASSSSSDAELGSSLTNLRSRSRQLVRDSSYAKRAIQLIVNNVVGTGIGLQAQVVTTRGDMAKAVNSAIEDAFEEWSCADYCHTGGRLCFSDIERFAIGQVAEAGEVIIRKHFRAFGDSKIPFALELIESERIADDLTTPAPAAIAGNEIRMGIEVDQRFYRPQAYYIRSRHPNEFQWGGATPTIVERVPADQIIHLSLTTRWPQTRGEPWLHTAVRRLADMDGYSDAEITRARTQALTPWTIETPQGVESFGEVQADGAAEVEMQSGTALRLNPGEKLGAGPSGAPNPALDPFMRYMVREIASGIGVSYESLSRDYSQSNYSSSRLALLDDRDVWRWLQRWFVDAFREEIHETWLEIAVLSGAIPAIGLGQYAAAPEKFEAARFKTRGWEWVDPEKEEAAAAKAVADGFTTVSDILGQKGIDLEDMLDRRAHELELMKEAGLVFETSPAFYTKQGQQPAAPADTNPADPNVADPNAPKARVLKLT